MDREELKGYLERGLSLVEIGVLVNRDPSTVGYWVRKHGLVANGSARYAPKGGLDREELRRLLDDGLTIAEMARRLDRSVSTVRHWLTRYGLLPEERKQRRGILQEAERRGLSRVEARCRRHGLVEFVRRPDGGWRCGLCRSQNVSNWRRRVKADLVAEAGGKCILCGYDRYVGALHFHHLDPGTKKFSIAMNGATRSRAEARREASKCALLCANCHAEVEGGVATLT